MSPATLLVVYCVTILLASLAGGLVPLLVRVTHRRLETALSFVSGVMLGVALMHLLPHAVAERAAWVAVASGVAENASASHGHGEAAIGTDGHELLEPVTLWLLAGFLAMFFLERLFPFHHHEAPHDEPRAGSGSESGSGAGGGGNGERADRSAAAGDTRSVGPTCESHGAHDHRHRLTWLGATVGLVVHSLVAGIALAASVEAATHHAGSTALAGFGTFLVIVLHKPFDALTIATLMAAGNHPRRFRHLVNGLFSLAIPAGAVLFLLGLTGAGESSHRLVACALAFSAGTFLCISLSDLLPELQFHRHDRLRLSIALVLGLGLAWAVGILE